MSMKHTKSATTMYTRLFAMVILSFFSMYFLMYAMVDSISNIHNSFNEVYMAGLMTAPMIIIEIGLMGSMYENKHYNLIIAILSLLLGIFFFFAIRSQLAVGDVQFLRSMIPHHAGAILMCDKANIQDSEIKQLCSNILSGQQKEIEQMKAILERLQQK